MIGALIKYAGGLGVIIAVDGCECKVAPVRTVDGAQARTIPIDSDLLDAGEVPLGAALLIECCVWVQESECSEVGRVSRFFLDRLLRRIAKNAARDYSSFAHAPIDFEPGVSAAPVSGRVWGSEEVESLTDTALDFWLTTGR